MAIRNIIAAGVGFSPGSVKFIPTRGFLAGAAAVVAESIDVGEWPARRRKRLIELHNQQFIQLVELALPHLVKDYRKRH